MLTEPLAELEARLRVLRLLYDRAPAPNGSADNDQRDRFAAHQSLHALVDFMKVMPGWAGLDFALIHLMVALQNVSDGSPERWLENHAPNRHGVPIEIATARGWCAGLMEMRMVRATESPKAAAQLVQRGLSKAAAKQLGVAKWETIAGWRYAARKAPDGMPERQGFLAAIATSAQSGFDMGRALKAISRTFEKSPTL